MNIHEYQAKALFRNYQIAVPNGVAIHEIGELDDAMSQLHSSSCVVKAQVHAGGRGKAGGVKLVSSAEEARTYAQTLLGAQLVTHQTDEKGQPVSAILIEETCDIARELYLGIVIDRAHRRIAIMASTEGGMDIEEVAEKTPEKIKKVFVDPSVGLQGYQCRQLAFALDLEASQIREMSALLKNLYRLYRDKDANLVEINPLVVTSAGKLLALDGKINFDNNAMYRQSEILAMRDESQEDERECKAQAFGLNYISLDGDIACMVNGAGLAMATMDLIKLHGGEPANFLDVGGGTTAEKVAEALKLILSDSKVRAILVNIFGGIVRCDLIAEGIIKAVHEVGIELPVVVRLEGTNAEQGRALLNDSDLSILTATSLDDAAGKAVGAAA